MVGDDLLLPVRPYQAGLDPGAFEQHDRLVRLAGSVLSTCDWPQLMRCVAQAFDGVVAFRARIWALGPSDVTEVARFPVDEAPASRPTAELAKAGNAAEVVRGADGTVFAPLRALGVRPMLLELHGVSPGELSNIDEIARIVASRAAYLAVADPVFRVLPPHRGTDEVARAIRGFSTALQQLLRHDRLTVFLLTAGDRAVERFAVAGAVPPDEDTITPISEFGLRECLLRERPLLTEDLARDRAPHSRGARVLARAGFRSSLSVPLRMPGRRMGILQLLSRSAGYYLEQDVRVAQDIADHAAPFIDHLRRQESVRPAALREALETERTRMGRDLGQVARGGLASARDRVTDLLATPPPATELQASLDSVTRLLDSVGAEISAAIADVAPAPLRSRPFEEVLRETLRTHGAEFGCATELHVGGDLATVSMTARRMSHGVLIAALASARAAGAQRVSVSVTAEDELLLNVTDDGSPGPRHLDPETAAPNDMRKTAECVHALGGRMHTEYDTARGTTLVLELPRTQPVRRDLEDERWLAAVPESRLSPARALRVFVLDQQGVRRAGLTHFLDAQHELRVVGHAAGIEESRRSIGWLQPDVVFIDAEDDSAADASRQVHQACPDSVVIGLSSAPRVGLAEELAAAGMVGVLPQNLESTELLDSIDRLVGGGSADTGTPASDHSSEDGTAALNSREWSVLRLIAEGFTNAEIGARLYLAPKTIERHVASLTRKVGARNRAHLVAVAIGRGLVRPPSI